MVYAKIRIHPVEREQKNYLENKKRLPSQSEDQTKC